MRKVLHFLLFVAGALALVVGCNRPAAPVGSSGEASSDQRGVVLLRYNPGSESTEQREKGFLETLQQEYPQITILSSDEYCGTTPELSLDKAQQVLLKHGDNITGIFAVCEPNAAGVLRALEEQGLAGKVKFVGFDPNERMVEALREGKMAGIVLQDPVTMGYKAVQVMIAHLNGEQGERRIATGEHVATPENMDEPRMQELLRPEQQDSSAAQPANPKYRIAVIPKGTTHEFWKSVHYGAQKAATEAGDVEIIWKGPQLESDREAQINLVQDFITKKVSGIVLAPLDSQALVDVVREAKAAGIPAVIFDSGLEDEEALVSYVATDNFHGGQLAARCLAEALGHGAAESAEPTSSPDAE
jgi:ABC-type sugar transport system substrate-binding protein